MSELTQVRLSLIAIATMLEQSIPSNQIAKIKEEVEKLKAYENKIQSTEEITVPQIHPVSEQDELADSTPA